MKIYLLAILICISLYFYFIQPGDVIIYTYKGITVYRIAKPGKSIFYYNKIGNNQPQIWAEYSGINDGFKGYLVFEESGKVSILSGDGYFQYKNQDSTKFDFKETSFDLPKLDEYTYKIQDAIFYEKIHNKGNSTRVKVVYPD